MPSHSYERTLSYTIINVTQLCLLRSEIFAKTHFYLISPPLRHFPSLIMNRSRFTKLDAFTKTVEDARIRTTSGGIVTLSSILIILYLVWGEWAEYRRVVVKPQLIVDKSRGEKMEIHMNMTFPRIPCELLTLDVMDVSGETQTGVMHGVAKIRLGPEGEGSKPLEVTALELYVQEKRSGPVQSAFYGYTLTSSSTMT